MCRVAEQAKSYRIRILPAIYGFIDRQNLPGLLRAFDFADPDTPCAQRFDTTVPQQALFFMNSPFVMEQATSMLKRPDVKQVGPGARRIHRLYQLVYQREASAEEIELALRFIEARSVFPSGQPEAKEPAKEASLTPWEEYAQVLLLSNELMFVD